MTNQNIEYWFFPTYYKNLNRKFNNYNILYGTKTWFSVRLADHSSRGALPTVVRRCVWSRNIKNWGSIYIYDIRSLRINDLTLILLT